MAVAVNKQSATTGITAESDGKGNLILTDVDGYDISVSTTDATALTGMVAATLMGVDDANTAVTVDAAGVTVGAQLTLSSKTGFTATDAADATVFAIAGANASTIASVADIDVSTVAGATSALATVDAALANISDQRAALGAVQNRFESTVNNLQTSAENLSASRSRIQDADFASETANLSRSQILQQAGTAMVAQANQLPQGVLALLR
jgi:flagellin